MLSVKIFTQKLLKYYIFTIFVADGSKYGLPCGNPQRSYGN